MKIAIVYYSGHHENTKKLLDAAAMRYDVTLIKADSLLYKDLSAYDMVGFASGIYYANFHKSVLDFAKNNLSANMKVFLIYTSGRKRLNYIDEIKKIIDAKHARLMRSFGCVGYDTFGPFKFIGGINKDRPNDKDIADMYACLDQIID